MIAWINGFLGTALLFGIGSEVLHLGLWELGRAWFWSQTGGVIGLLLILQAEKVPWIRKHLLFRSTLTWIAFASLYYGFVLGGAPVMRELRYFEWLALPLILGNGFAILIFGPIQDRIVRRAQQRRI